MRAALVLCGVALAVPARADCEHFKWSVASARAAFATAPPLAAGPDAAAPGKAFVVDLTPGLALPVRPEREPGAGTSAAAVSLPRLGAGTYQFTLSDEAWIDVAQDGALVKSSDFSGQKDCPGVRKSVRFPLREGPATLLISNAAVATIRVMLESAP